MSPATAYFLGIFSGFMMVAITAWWAVTWFRHEPSRGLSVVAGILRVLSDRTGYQSALIALGGVPVVVPLEQMARAIEKGSLLNHRPVTVTRSDRPPPPKAQSHPEEPPDGHA